MSGPPLVSRRAVLLGGAGTVLLAACGGGGDDDRSLTTGTVPQHNLIALFAPQGVLVYGEEQRITLAVADAEGVPLQDAPAELEFSIRADGQTEGTPVTAQAHSEGLPAPYYPVHFTPQVPGLYEVSTTLDGEELTPRSFQVNNTVTIPTVGGDLPPVATPTTANHRGVDPICTRDPACPFHEVSLDDALTAGGPVAFLIATPEFCQTALCGPVLDVLVDVAPDHPGVTFIHAEVYANPTAVDDITQAELAPATQHYQLPFEPCLFLADSSGTLVTRLDNIYDREEADEALSTLS